MLATITLTASHFGMTQTYTLPDSAAAGSDNFTAPGVWDVVSFTGGTFFSLLSGSISDIPIGITYLMWFLTFCVVGSLVWLIRGVS